MIVRKRTGNGKSLKMRIKEKLKFIAKSDNILTFRYTLEAHDTEVYLNFNYNEARDIANTILKELGENNEQKKFNR